MHISAHTVIIIIMFKITFIFIITIIIIIIIVNIIIIIIIIIVWSQVASVCLEYSLTCKVHNISLYWCQLNTGISEVPCWLSTFFFQSFFRIIYQHLHLKERIISSNRNDNICHEGLWYIFFKWLCGRFVGHLGTINFTWNI